jgi:hypothetical protein
MIYSKLPVRVIKFVQWTEFGSRKLGWKKVVKKDREKDTSKQNSSSPLRLEGPFILMFADQSKYIKEVAAFFLEKVLCCKKLNQEKEEKIISFIINVVLRN